MRKTISLLCLICLSLPGKAQAPVSGSISFSPQEITIESDGQFSHIRYDGYEYTSEPGKPSLPVRTLSYVVPFDARVSGVQITSLEKQQLPGKYTVYPAQYPIPTGEASPGFAPPDSLTYHSSAPYPGKTVEIISDEYTHGYHVVTLRFYPVEYIPLEGRLSLCTIGFTLSYTLTPGFGDEMRFRRQTAHRAALGRASIGSMVENIRDIDTFGSGAQQVVSESNRLTSYSAPSLENIPQTRSNPVTEQLIPDYLIITNNALKPTFQRLADWKTRKGVPAVIKTVEEIEPNYPGNDLQEKIRNFLKDAYRNWGANLFVLLGGDVNIVPARTIYMEEIKSKKVYGPSDLYYATIDGDWNANKNNIYNEEDDGATYGRAFYLGRAPVENMAEANTFIDKIITYETTNGLPDLSYLNNYLGANGYLEYSSYSNRFIAGAMSSIQNIFKTSLPSYINRWLQFDNYNCSPSSHKYELCEIGKCPCGNEEFNHNNFLSALNNGGNSGLNHFHFIYHSDHSSAYGMGASSKDKNHTITREEIDNLSNGKYYQIILSNGCDPAEFSLDCIAEHHLNLPDNGCVAFIGNTKHGWYGEEPQLRNFLNALYNSSDNYSLGYAFNQASLYSYYDDKSRLHLLGDPEMPVWTNTPQPLQVTVGPSTLSSGGNIIIVTLPNLPQGVPARICLTKGDEGYAAQTVEVKQIGETSFEQRSFYFYFTPKSPGEVSLTVTAHNYIPFQTTIPVSGTPTRSLYLTDKEIQDDNSPLSQGNEDNQCDAGETIALWLSMTNNGSSHLDSVKAQVQCFSPLITLLDSIVPFGSIPPGDTVRSASPLRFKIDKDAPELWTSSKSDSTAIFFLQISDHDDNWYTDSIGVDLFAPLPQQRSKLILLPQAGLSQAHPGDSVAFDLEIFNAGKASVTGLQVTLTPRNNPYAECPAQTVSYPEIPFKETKTGDTPFGFRVKSNYTGQTLTFRATLVNRFGKQWTLDFDLNRPVVIDASQVDYTASPSEIEIFWTPLASAGGYNIYRKTASGAYEKLNRFLLESAYYKDSGLSPTTPYTYKVSAVSPSGNEGGLSGEIAATTSLPYYGKFPVFTQTDFYVLSSINTADFGNGKKKIFAALNLKHEERPSYLLGLDFDGGDLFNADHNVTTHGDFAYFPVPMAGTPAIGDLYGNGEMVVVCATRDLSYKNNTLSCFRAEDRNGDREPDLLWQVNSGTPCYRGPVMANLDGNAQNRKYILYRNDHKHIHVHTCEGNRILTIEPDAVSSGSGAIAVADLDGDGDLEIIAGYAEGVFIWHHDGKRFGNSNPVFTKPGYRFDSSVIVCDLDEDGQKEILIAAKSAATSNPSESPVFVFRPDGTSLSSWNGAQKNQHSNYNHSHDISVGDLDGDGHLEVVSVGCDYLKVWNRTGQQLLSLPLEDTNPYNLTPILADVDGDEQAEIIFNSKSGVSKIFAYKLDGKPVPGFPLKVEGSSDGSLCVDDIDGDGKNEIIAGAISHVYAWKTNGRPGRIEWGKERCNSSNTGEYLPGPGKIAANTVDYSSTDVSITLSWPSLTGAKSYNIYRVQQNGALQKVNPTPRLSRSFTDNGLTQATRYTYRISAVSDQGREGLLSEEISANTTYPIVSGFPVSPKLGYYFFSSVNVAGFGDQGKKIFSALNHDFGGRPGYLFGVNPDGSNLYPGDATIRGDFAYFADPMYATPAIGDLNGDGVNLIVTGTMDQVWNNPHNTIACYRIDDRNKDGEPDLLWEKTVAGPYYRGPVIANFDGNALDKKQILFLNQYKPVEIYRSDGSLYNQINAGIDHATTNGSAPAVADLDNDGDKEIIIGYKEGVRIWHHSGQYFVPKNPVFSRTGYRFDSSPVICDLDGDGEKEIVIAAKEDRTDNAYAQSPVFAFRPDGSLLPGWDGSQRTTHTDKNRSHDIAVGDIDGDGWLEVVVVGIDTLKVWNYKGELLTQVYIKDMQPYNLTPILADVDDDDQAEILVATNKNSSFTKLWGFKPDGTHAPGFPLTVVGRSDGSICVDDIDGDGKNEIIGGSTAKMYMWKTDGRPDRIEWGRERFDQYNSGEYNSGLCAPTVITGNTSWSNTRSLCGNLIVRSGTLTMKKPVISIAGVDTRLAMDPGTWIVVKEGGTLIFDNVVVENARIHVMAGGKLVLKGNANIWLATQGGLKIEKGGIFENQYGNVDLMENKPSLPDIKPTDPVKPIKP